MILPDWEIESAIERGVLGVDPYDPSNLQPASLDVRLSGNFRVFDHQATGLGSKYQGQVGPMESKVHRNFERTA